MGPLWLLLACAPLPAEDDDGDDRDAGEGPLGGHGGWAAGHELDLPPLLDGLVAQASEEELRDPVGLVRATCQGSAWELELDGVYEEISEAVVVGLDPLSDQPFRGEVALAPVAPGSSSWTASASAEELGWPCEGSRLLLSSASLGVDGVLYRSGIQPWGEDPREVLWAWLTDQHGGLLEVQLLTETGPDAAVTSALSLHRRLMVGPVALEPDEDGTSWSGTVDLRPFGPGAEINTVDLLFAVSLEGELLDVDGY